MRKEFRDLASVEKAKEVAEKLTPKRRTVEVPLTEARDRVLSESIDSPIDVPGFDRSLMDGYAVRAQDTHGADETRPAVFDLIGKVSAGEPPDVQVGKSEAAEISTGAPIPEGADAVVPVEETSSGKDGTVRVHKALAPADSIMFAGSDIAAGEVALFSGTELSSREIGLSAALGKENVPVYAPPRVGIVSTGDELVRPGGTLEEGQIYDVNTFSVVSAAEAAGAEPIIYEHVGDEYERMVDVLRRAAEECEIVLSSGSTSASTEDVVYRVVEEKGELLLHGVSLKPGRPTVFGRLEGTAFVGLPGNPISALSVYRMFVSEMVRKAGGKTEKDDEVLSAKVPDEVRTEGGRTRLLPVGLIENGEELLAYSVDKGSGATTSLTRADGYVTVEPSTKYLAEGQKVGVTVFENGSPPDVLGAGESDIFVNELLTGCCARWLPIGSLEGTRRVRDGIADIAVVSLSREKLDSLGVEGTHLLRGYERRVGYVTRNGVTEGSFGTVPEGYGLRREFETATDVDAETVTFRSEDGVVNAVSSGKVDAGFCTEAIAREQGLEFEAVGWESLDILVADERADKQAVKSFLDAVEEAPKDAVGYRRPEDAGDRVESWD